DFLSWMYNQNRGLVARSYNEQLTVRNGSLFGDGGFYSANLRTLGHDAHDVYVNNDRLQSAWAREHGEERLRAPHWRFGLRKGFIPWLTRQADRAYLTQIVAAQVAHHRPDVVLNHAVNFFDADGVRQLKRRARLVVAQIASPLPQSDVLRIYD